MRATPRSSSILRGSCCLQAVHDYDCALVLEPNSAHVLHNRYITSCMSLLVVPELTMGMCRGILHTKLGKTELALADFTAVLAVDQRNVSALYNRGCLLDQLGNFEAAVADYSRALELDAGST